MHLNTGICLRTDEVRAFTLLGVISHSCALTPPPSTTFARSQLAFQAGMSLLTWDSQVEHRVGFCCASACSYTYLRCYWPWSRAVPQHLSQCISLMSAISAHFQHLSTSQDLHCLLSGTPPSFWEAVLLPGPILSVLTTHPQHHPCLHFASVNILCAQVQSAVSLLIVSSIPCLFA